MPLVEQTPPFRQGDDEHGDGPFTNITNISSIINRALFDRLLTILA